MIVWAVMPLIISNLRSIPALEILSIALLTSLLFTSLRIFFKDKISDLNTTPTMTIVGTFAVSVTAAFYIMAFKYAPPIHIELVMYIWPILVILGNMVFFNEKVSLIKCIAVFFCFMALIVLHYENLAIAKFNNGYYIGYALTMCASIIWTFYNIFARAHRQTSSELMGLYAGIGAGIIIPLHFMLEDTIIPNFFQLGLIITIGIFSKGLAYQAWDSAVKNVNPVVMTNIAYCTPILSVILLALFGFGNLTPYVMTSCILLIVASILISPSSNTRQ